MNKPITIDTLIKTGEGETLEFNSKNYEIFF